MEASSLNEATILMKCGEHEVPIAVATYKELLQRLPDTLRILSESMIITALTHFEANVPQLKQELAIEFPSA